MGACQDVRRACAEVAAGAGHVRIDEDALASLARSLTEAPPGPASLDPAHHHLGEAAETLAFVLTLDSVNFGSGWFPELRKRPGLSGYFTIATSLRERFEARGPWSAQELAGLDAKTCADVFGQAGVAGVAELMELFAHALRELGGFLRDGYAGRFEGPLEEAGGSAEALVGVLARMPCFRDVATWRGRPVPLYKRAQLTAADLALALDGRGLGAFHDFDRLTLFADNLVPHVLRCAGVLVYRRELAARIDAELPLAAGSEEEVEIRAVAVHAVERLSAETARAGHAMMPRELDYELWNRGQRPESKARPRHRARSVFY
jgi:hypothetical protein